MREAMNLAGFFAAHAVWCVSDGETLIPIFGYPDKNGQRVLNRLVHDRLEDAVAAGSGNLSKARNVRLTLNYSSREIQLSAQDDGIGFVPETVLTGNGTGHFGLHGIRSRARKIDAKLSISSQPGKGTEITATLPLPSENSATPTDDKKSPS